MDRGNMRPDIYGLFFRSGVYKEFDTRRSIKYPSKVAIMYQELVLHLLGSVPFIQSFYPPLFVRVRSVSGIFF